MTLLELMLATAMMATIVTAVSVILRTGYTTWLAQDADTQRMQAVHATLRHLVRNIRQAEAVMTISAAENNSGSLALLMPSGETYAWAHDTATSQVRFGLNSPDHLLAEFITELSLAGYAADGVTQTNVPEEIHLIHCTARTSLPSGTGGANAISSWAWIRAW